MLFELKFWKSKEERERKRPSTRRKPSRERKTAAERKEKEWKQKRITSRRASIPVEGRMTFGKLRESWKRGFGGETPLGEIDISP